MFFLKGQHILTLLNIQMTIIFPHTIQCAAMQSTSIRKNVSLVFDKSIGKKGRKMSPFTKL